ncbi:MAG: O-antigen ligase family protein [Burkholderiaceae bacterium]|nr:O-antigen ligase family protein [Burkholderiaceae bacterium]
MHAPVNAQVDAVFVLSVRSFKDRIAHIEQELGKHGISFEWIFEYDTDELTPQLIESTFAPSDLGPPQQSLVLKHIETWRRCVDRGYRRVLVFEDDAMLASDFAQVFSDAMSAADALEGPYMVYLGCGDNKHVRSAANPESPLVLADMPLPAADAIVFDQRAARLRLDYVAQRRITRPADWLMREADATMGIAQHWLRQPIVEQGSMNGRFASVLDRKRMRRGRAWSWLRFRWDRWRRQTLGALPDESVPRVEVAHSQQRRDDWALKTARVAAAMVAIGSFTGAALANIAAGVMLLAFLGAPSCWQRIRRTWTQPLGTAVIAFLGVLLLATLWSTVPWRDALAAWTGWRAFLLVFITLSIFDTRAQKLVFAVLFVSVASAATVASFFAFDFGAAQEFSNVKGGIVMRNHVTQAMALIVGTAFSLVLFTHTPRGSWMRWLWVGTAALMLLNVVFVAYARSGYVALIIVLVAAALGLWRGRERGVALLGVIVLTASAVQFSPLITQRFSAAVEEVKQNEKAVAITDMGIRVVMWDVTGALVRESPLLGHGVGSFPEAYRRIVTQRHSGWKATLTADPHNQYLLILVETGLLGLAAFAWFLFSAVRQPVRGPFRVIGVALLLAWCATSLFSSHFRAFNEAHLIAMVLGMCLAREAREQTQPRKAASTAALTSS